MSCECLKIFNCFSDFKYIYPFISHSLWDSLVATCFFYSVFSIRLYKLISVTSSFIFICDEFVWHLLPEIERSKMRWTRNQTVWLPYVRGFHLLQAETESVKRRRSRNLTQFDFHTSGNFIFCWYKQKGQRGGGSQTWHFLTSLCLGISSSVGRNRKVKKEVDQKF